MNAAQRRKARRSAWALRGTVMVWSAPWHRAPWPKPWVGGGLVDVRGPSSTDPRNVVIRTHAGEHIRTVRAKDLRPVRQGSKA